MSAVPTKYCLIIPAFNESSSLSNVFDDCKKLLYERSDLEICIIDNGSTDKTRNILAELIRQNNNARLKMLVKDINTGYGAGIKYGLSHSTAPFLIWTHADLQCDLLDVLKAINFHEKLDSRKNIVVKGMRQNRNLLDNLFSQALSFLNRRLNGTGVLDIYSQPNLVSSKFVSEICELPDDSTFELYVLTQLERLECEIYRFPVLFNERRYGIGYNEGMIRKFRFSLKCIRAIIHLRKINAHN
jgi:glycosyltransferase involved in cell wall biosynthesis